MLEEDSTQPIRALLSFHYFRGKDLDEIAEGLTVGDVRPDLFADSGAFSAQRSGASITLDEYESWVNKWRHVFTVYANLDVIGDGAASMRNLVELEKRGLEPLPVFHTHTEDMSVLEELCERYEYVAIGGMVGYRGATIFPWLVKCHKVARKHGTGLHGFGQTSRRPLQDLPWYSVDSSSWTTGFRYGKVCVFDAEDGCSGMYPLKDRDLWLKREPLVRSYGFSPADFYDRSRNTRDHNICLSALGFRRFERWLLARHGPTKGPANLTGPRVYLADSPAGTGARPDLNSLAALLRSKFT